VVVQGGYSIRLERTHSLLFRPTGELGVGWTLDLPTISQEKRVARRTGDQVEFSTIFSLQSPLHTVSARFDQRRVVPEVNGELSVSDSSPEILDWLRATTTGSVSKQRK